MRASLRTRTCSTSLVLWVVALLIATFALPIAQAGSGAFQVGPDDLERLALWRGGGGDVDADGVLDENDNCVDISNPDQIDTDGDGFGNFCDGDLNNSGVTNIGDLALFRVAFFSTPGASN
ncbi:MAG: thrombospondin type 3 repeat-containing protein [Gammaproteobacteria bacterium]